MSARNPKDNDPVLPAVEERVVERELVGAEAALGETFAVPIGPIHPALKEPIRLTFRVRGERIVGVDIRTGFAHRGIEFMGMRQGRNLIQILYLAERICGICSVSHPIAFTQAVERAAGIEVPPRAQYIRVIISELERIHSHLLWAGVAAHELGFDTLLHLTWRVREKVLDVLEELSGNRIDYAIPIFGGVRRDIAPEQYPKVWEAIRYYRGLLEQLLDAFLRDPTVEARTRGVGVLEPKEAEELCAVGPTARASGLRKDVRQDRPYLAYPDFQVRAITPEDYGLTPVGDVYDKIVVRLLEVEQSLNIIEQALENMPEGEITSFPKIPALLAYLKKAEGEGLGWHEAPRGEVIHYVRLAAGEESLLVWKVKAPTYSNLLSWYPMFEDQEIADIPIIAASIDPCICCMDRVYLVRGGKEEVWPKEKLLKLSWEKTRRMQR
ncbi:MAG: nickel-dependent hydrogenase large subunit [Candidatus Bipolaricaulota bacterium]|nr:nickel-dependent hydrogenase large subunit [Candidatus Bipolaricaulota bacterium]MCX7844111.1 nickel-dependent hydrogenase large subunit [Candidatus Bipolaricaulota bacterium]MDW8152301.1 nickel-dependent hydrogenase large subunit [Candidatus Bipolaricaulota bacterium]